MKRILVTLLSAICVCVVPSCEKATPEQTFARAVINTNLMSGFAGSGMRYQLENPSVKLTPSGGTSPMTRKEWVDSQIRSIDESYQKTRKLVEDDDNRDMLQASIALYNYVLPVYRDEYTQLAGLYDRGAGKAELEVVYKAIADRYLEGYRARSAALNAAGKPFAERHGIRVKWDIQTSPSP